MRSGSTNYPALVIGCGNIGSSFDEVVGSNAVRTHANAYAKCCDTELVALCDKDVKRLETASSFFGVKCSYIDHCQALVDVKPLIVSVATPDPTHFSVCLDVIKCPSVRVLIIEKPIATNLFDAEKLSAAAAYHEVIIIVNYSRRFSSAYQRLRKQLRAGRIGSIELVHGYYSKGLLHNGSHWLDLARWLVGDFQVTASSFSMVEIGQDPTCDLKLEFDQGARGILSGVAQKNFFLFEMDLIGSSGRLRISRNEFEWFTPESDKIYLGFNFLRSEREHISDIEDTMSKLIENAVLCLRGLGEPGCSSKDAIWILQQVDWANQLCCN